MSIVNDGLVLYFDAIDNAVNGVHDGSTPVWVDLSGNGNNGTLDGGTWGENFLHFNGSSWVNCGARNPSKITLEVLVKYDEIGGSSVESNSTVGNWQSGGYGIQQKYGLHSANINIDGTWYHLYGSAPKTENIVHLALTYDNSTIKLYENGRKVAEKSISGNIKPPSSSTVFSIGSNPEENSFGINGLKGNVYSVRLYERALSADEVFGNYKYDYGRFIGNNEILLVQSAENSSNEVTSCSLTLENCTVGNTLILVCAVRGTDNTPTLIDGWKLVGGGNVVSTPDSTCQKIYFVTKKVENTTETVTLTQTTTDRIYLVCGEFSGDFSIVMRNDMANRGTSNYTVTATKDTTNNVILYAVSSSYYPSGRSQSCEPNDLTKLQGNADAERLACWFDDGSGEVSHTFKTCNYTENNDAIVECVQLTPKQPKESKYLIRNNDIVYTVQNDSLVEVVGDLNAQLFIDNGVDDIPSGTLLMTLSKPELLCWEDTEKDLPKLTATVTATPVGQYITKVIDISNASISGINNVTVECTGTPWFSCSFDGGITWMEYSGGTWIEVELYGMAKETLVSITSDEWYSATSGIDRFIMRVLLRSSSDSLTNLSVNFLNVTT